MKQIKYFRLISHNPAKSDDFILVTSPQDTSPPFILFYSLLFLE